MSKYLEYFSGAFDSTVAEKIKPENKPYVAYSRTEGVIYTVITEPIIGPANNEIWYWGEYYDIESAISVLEQQDMTYVGPAILSNKQVGDKYVITFDGPVTKLGADEELGEFYPVFVDIQEDGIDATCNITRIEIPNSVTSIGDSAFYGCSSLTSVTIPENVSSIGDGAFYECSSLTSVTINSDAIVNKAYTYSSNLSNIFGSQVTEYIIGNNVKGIGEGAFFGCTSLTSVTIPNSVTSIDGGAFWRCTSLTSVTIPNSVTSIGDYAFTDCTSLTSVTIPNSVASIRDHTFWNCSSLTSVTIPNSVTSIGISAFRECSSLTSITIPNSVTSIGISAFRNCSSLTTVTCEALTPLTLGGTSTFDNTNNCPIYVPAQSVEAYKAAPNWSYCADKIQPIQ